MKFTRRALLPKVLGPIMLGGLMPLQLSRLVYRHRLWLNPVTGQVLSVRVIKRGFEKSKHFNVVPVPMRTALDAVRGINQGLPIHWQRDMLVTPYYHNRKAVWLAYPYRSPTPPKTLR